MGRTYLTLKFLKLCFKDLLNIGYKDLLNLCFKDLLNINLLNIFIKYCVLRIY